MRWLNTKSAPKDRDEQLAAKPLRSAQAKMELRDDGGALLKLPIRSFGPFRAPAGAAKKFELDATGLFVWERCDGVTPLAEIVQSLAEKLQLDADAAESATMKFMQTLASRPAGGPMKWIRTLHPASPRHVQPADHPCR